MQIGDLIEGYKPVLLDYSLEESPHLTIETNHSCNIKCRSCYNIDNTFVKEFELIKEEILLGQQKRKIQCITLIGGEPTLHPSLPEIISFIKKQKLQCQLLSNGIRFLDDPSDAYLDKLISAGLDKIILHIDQGQEHIHNDLDKVIKTLFDKFEKRKIFFSLSNTIFHDTQGQLALKIRHFSVYRYFDGILALLSRDCKNSIQAGFNPVVNSSLLSEHRAFSKSFGIQPVAYIPSSIGINQISWLFYFFYYNIQTGQSFQRSPRFLRIVLKIFKAFSGKNTFAFNINPSTFHVLFLISTFLEIILNPARIKEVTRLLKNSGYMSKLRIMTVVIQNPPEFNNKYGKMQLCHHCPDATIRNGMLTPLCLADIINPIDEVATVETEIPRELFREVYEHMGEIPTR